MTLDCVAIPGVRVCESYWHRWAPEKSRISSLSERVLRSCPGGNRTDSEG